MSTLVLVVLVVALALAGLKFSGVIGGSTCNCAGATGAVGATDCPACTASEAEPCPQCEDVAPWKKQFEDCETNFTGKVAEMLQCEAKNGTLLADLDDHKSKLSFVDKALAVCESAKNAAIASVTASGCALCEDTTPLKNAVAECDTAKGTCLSDLAKRTSERDAFNADFSKCTTGKTAMAAELAAVTTARTTAVNSLAAANTDLATANARIVTLQGSLATSQGDTAAENQIVRSMCNQLSPTATNVSSTCWTGYYQNDGCKTTPTYDATTATQTRQYLEDRARYLANNPAFSYRARCYGDALARTKTLAECDAMPLTQVDVGPECANKLWQQAGCNQDIRPVYDSQYAARDKAFVIANGKKWYTDMINSVPGASKVCKGL